MLLIDAGKQMFEGHGGVSEDVPFALCLKVNSCVHVQYSTYT